MAKHIDIVPTSVTGGCIRFGKKSRDNPIGIYLHENDAHDSVGIRDIDLDDRGRIVVKHSTGGPVVTMGAMADETLVARGISLGCSGGTGKTVIVVALHGEQLNLRIPAHYEKVEGTYSNAWLFWVHLAK